VLVLSRSPDGTCIFTSDHDRTFTVYPIDYDLTGASSPRNLRPYAQFTSTEPIWAFAAPPYFNLYDSASTHVLVSSRDSYITLHNALWNVSAASESTPTNKPFGPVDISTKIASYKLIDNHTEAVIAPHSLTYTNHGTHFITGSQNQISLFDLNYTSEPTHIIRTIPSTRSKLKEGGRGYKGYVSALSVSPPSSSSNYGILAAGTWSRYIGLYDTEGSGGQITHFALPGTINGKTSCNTHDDPGTQGNGVSQLKWSPCGRYLYVAERKSDVVLIYDVRNFRLSLAHCVGRNAMTNQKMGFDVWSPNRGMNDPQLLDGNLETLQEVWAGGIDGKMRVWRDPHLKEGAVEADDVLSVGETPVVGTLVHPQGGVLVAASASLGGVGGEWEKERGSGPRYRGEGCLDIFSLDGYGSGHGPNMKE
jgi:hypothetical protein